MPGVTLKHGNARRGKRSPEYRSWLAMRWRCENPKATKYPQYGGRGIRICRRWASFANFLADMGPKPGPQFTLHRLDNDGNYEPGNCRWADPPAQCRNKRNNHFITFGGRSMCVTDWERHLGFPRSLVQSRLVLGWTIEAALTTPYRGRPGIGQCPAHQQ